MALRFSGRWNSRRSGVRQGLPDVLNTKISTKPSVRKSSTKSRTTVIIPYESHTNLPPAAQKIVVLRSSRSRYFRRLLSKLNRLRHVSRRFCRPSEFTRHFVKRYLGFKISCSLPRLTPITTMFYYKNSSCGIVDFCWNRFNRMAEPAFPSSASLDDKPRRDPC